jgi:Rod binding domain-containing protein
MDVAASDSQFLTQASNALNAGRSLPKAAHAQNMKQARKIARDFEAVFIGQMLQPMFQNIDAAEPFGGSSSEKMWRSMQVDEYGKAIAKAGGIGLADAVFRQILKAQENRSHGSNQPR